MKPIYLPIVLVSEANARGHWSTKSPRVQNQRLAARLAVADLLRRAQPQMPVVVTLTRIAPRKLDDDNLRSAFKAVRDGVADALGVNDGGKQVTWAYRDERRATRERAIEIVLEERVADD